MKTIYPKLFNSFEEFLSNYWNFTRTSKNKNEVLFDIEKKQDFCQAIIYYIAGMTDNFAIEAYNQIIGF